MQKIKFIVVSVIAVIILPLAGYAKEAIGSYTLEYDQKFEADTDNNGKNDRTSYYQGDRLVWSAYDEDGNGEPDLWLRYKNGDTVDLEIVDRDSNREPDKIAEFDYQGRREVIYDNAEGEESTILVKFFWIIIIFIAMGVGWKFWKKRNMRKTEKDQEQKTAPHKR